MKDKWLLDVCIFCGGEATAQCRAEHPGDVYPVNVSNILSEEEMRKS